MRKNSKIAIFVATIIAMSVFSLMGCKTVGYDNYENANLYTVGSVEVSAEKVKKLEIGWWVNGSIEVQQTTSQTLRVVEDRGPENDAERMHYYLDGEVLKVKYCEAGLRTTIEAEKKNLRVEIPVGMSLEIDTVKASVAVGVLEVKDFSVENDGGNVTVERIVCDEMEIEVNGGAVSIGELVARSVSVEGDSGDVSITRLSTDFLEVEVGSSDVSFGIQKALTAEVETIKGDVTFILAEGLGASIHLTTATGKFKTEKEYGKTGSRYDIFGGDGVSTDCKIEVDTFSGDVYVR